MVWRLERGNFSIGKNPLVAVVEIGDYEIHLPESLYGIKGKLFTPNIGIEKMIRNILRTETIEYLVVVGKEDVPYFYPYQALKCLFKHGVDESMRIIGAKGFNPVLKSLSMEEIEEFRRRVLFVDCMGMSEEDVKNILMDFIGEAYEDIEVEYIDQEVEAFPHPVFGIFIRAKDMVEAWELALRHVMLLGFRHESERGMTREVLNLIVDIADPTPREFPGIPRNSLERYFQETILSPKKRGKAYTYGERLHKYGSLREVIDKLKRNRNTRRAVVVLWSPRIDVKSEAPPCLCYMQFLIRRGRLYTTAVFRSHDVLNAYPYNLYSLGRLVEVLCGELDVKLGNLLVHSVSAHIYEDSLNSIKIKKVISDEKWEFVCDQVGYIHIYRKDGIIVADHYSPDGSLVQSFKCSSAEMMEHVLAKHLQGLRPEHYIWIGRELGRLERLEDKK